MSNTPLFALLFLIDLNFLLLILKKYSANTGTRQKGSCFFCLKFDFLVNMVPEQKQLGF